jgi:hypothetical protein
MADPMLALCRQVEHARHADPDRVRRWTELIALLVPPGHDVTEILSDADLISLWHASAIGVDEYDGNENHCPA